MKWFQGSVSEAIQTSKKKGSIFVVYIHGEDSLSAQMMKTWDDEEVSTVCEKADIVAITILANSEDCGYFSQIYPVVVVPSTYFIGGGGVPIEVTGGHMAAEDFANKIQSVLKVHKEQREAASKGGNSQLASGEAQNVVNSGAESGSGGDGSTVSPTGASAAPPAGPDVPLDERVERAKQLMEEKRQEKAKAEEQKKRDAELDRRNLGRDVQKLRQHQKEMELKETRDQLRKEKEEDRKAREKIKEQIARDREERAAKLQKEKKEKEEALEEKKKAKLLEQQQAAAEAEAKRSENARIQVRLADGSSVMQTFPATDKLHSLFDYVQQQTGGVATLSTTFPKRTFTEEDKDKTFAELQLAPSATVIAVTRRMGSAGGGAVQSGGGGGGFLAMLLSPLFMLWNFVYSLLFGGGSSASSQSPASQSHGQQSAEDRSRTRTSQDRPNTAYQRRPLRPDGNMHRLSDMRNKDDDENATWNGNSTQQM